MLKTYFYTTFFLLACASPALAQFTSADSSCACEKFPYYYCTQNNASNSIKVYCENDPWNATDVPQNPLGPTNPIRASSVFSCIERGIDPDTLPPGENPGNMPGYGWVWNAHSRVWIPGLNIDNSYWPQGGDWNAGAEMDGGGTTNYLALHWRNNLWSAFHTGPNQPPCVSFDSSCCITIVFQTDPNFYLDKGFEDASGVVGYADDDVDNQCTRTCGSHTIYINATDQFLYGIGMGDTIDWQNNPPTSLLRCYTVDAWTGGIAPHNLNVGSWYDWNVGAWNNTNVNVYAVQTFDFCSIIMHEMGHWIGLPDRDAFCWNTNGQYCGTEDSTASLMGGVMPVATVRNAFADEDNCWVRKLYCPQLEPTCASDAVQELESTSDITLEQSQPNPTNGAAEIGFSLDHRLLVSFNVYDILGKRVMQLVNNQFLDAGDHVVSVPPNVLPSGKYIYSLRAGGSVKSKIMTIMK